MRIHWLMFALVLALTSVWPGVTLAQREGGGSATSTSKASPKAAQKAAAKPANARRPTSTARAREAGKAAPQREARSTRGTRQRVAARRAVVPARPSEGQLAGLRQTEDPLDLRSSVALVVDQNTHEVLLAKNEQAVLPIASITKLMTALVVSEAQLPLEESLVVSPEDVAAYPGRRSQLRAGSTLTRGELLHLALMASENRAAHALGRTFPGGMAQFVGLMNAKARELGMSDTRYVEPTGLSAENRSSAQDLVRLVQAAFLHPVLREFSTTVEAAIPLGRRQVQFHTTNGLVRNPEWSIGLQKTGFIAAAGRCVVMQAQLAGRQLIMVLLDSTGRYARMGDAERIRRWLGAEPAAVPAPATGPTPVKAPVAAASALTVPAWAKAAEVLDLDTAAAAALHPSTR